MGVGVEKVHSSQETEIWGIEHAYQNSDCRLSSILARKVFSTSFERSSFSTATGFITSWYDLWWLGLLLVGRPHSQRPAILAP